MTERGVAALVTLFLSAYSGMFGDDGRPSGQSQKAQVLVLSSEAGAGIPLQDGPSAR